MKANTLSVHSKDQMYVIDSGACVNMLRSSSLTEQEKKSIPDTQAKSGTFRAQTVCSPQTLKRKCTSGSLILFYEYIQLSIRRPCFRWGDFAANLAIPVSGRQVDLTVYLKCKKWSEVPARTSFRWWHHVLFRLVCFLLPQANVECKPERERTTWWRLSQKERGEMRLSQHPFPEVRLRWEMLNAFEDDSHRRDARHSSLTDDRRAAETAHKVCTVCLGLTLLSEVPLCIGATPQVPSIQQKCQEGQQATRPKYPIIQSSVVNAILTAKCPRRRNWAGPVPHAFLHHGIVTSHNVIRAEPGLITTAEHDLGEVTASHRIAHIRNVCTLLRQTQ